MRKIEYIFIESDCQRCNSASEKPNSFEFFRVQAGSSNAQDDDSKSDCCAVSLFRHHFIVNKEGLVSNPIDISSTANLIQGPIYDRNKYNRCSISIHYCGSLEPGSLDYEVREKLIRLLVELRSRFPDAKILATNEFITETVNSKHGPHGSITVSNSMNLLRRELSDMP